MTFKEKTCTRYLDFIGNFGGYKQACVFMWYFLFFDFIESYFLQSDFYPGLRKIPRMYPYSGNQVPLQNGGLWETLEIHKGISLL
jgi:hypothetical protein